MSNDGVRHGYSMKVCFTKIFFFIFLFCLNIFLYLCSLIKHYTMTTFEIISLIATAGIFAGLFNIGKKIGSFEESLKNIASSMRALPCEQHKIQLEAMHDDIVAIKTFLTTKYKNAETIWGKKHSPTILNENGVKLLTEISGYSFLGYTQRFIHTEIVR